MVNNKYKVLNVKDWSKIKGVPKSTDASTSVNNVLPNQMGLYKDGDGEYHTSGYVGIKRLLDRSGNSVKVTDNREPDYGNEIVLNVSPRFKLDQWEMLATVMKDDEFDKYINGDSNRFYEVYYHEKPIKISTHDSGGELILAISFLRCCQELCKKQLKAKMSFIEANFNGKIRGNILVSKNIKQNIVMGRIDRIYCRYSTFTIDTLENRILKAAVLVAEQKIKKNIHLKEVHAMIRYCKTCLQNVRRISIKKSDFSQVKITGFNSYYKASIEFAKMLLLHCGMDINSKLERNNERIVIPYVIKMEVVFEFYVRSKIKEYLKNNKMHNLRLDNYRRLRDKDVLQTITQNSSSAYLMTEYFPDIALMRKNEIGESWKYIAVYEVKYQNHIHPASRESIRHNSHQLLFYMLLLNVNKCGFIFPEVNGHEDINIDAGNKVREESPYTLSIQNGYATNDGDMEYTQWTIGHEQSNINSMFERLVKYSEGIKYENKGFIKYKI